MGVRLLFFYFQPIAILTKLNNCSNIKLYLNQMEKESSKTNDFSAVGILISFLLAICLLYFAQFFIKDLNSLYNGTQPIRPSYEKLKPQVLDRTGNVNFPIEQPQPSEKNYTYNGVSYSTYTEANDAFEKEELLPYQSRKLVISAIVNIPLFVIATGLFISLGRKRSSYRVVTGSFFGSMFLSITMLLIELASMVYRYNQKIATYGILSVLILVFIITIVLIQDRHRKPKQS